MKADIIIGANFGDEGKGLITDFHASRHDKCLVVRHNSGPQAGHTVTLKNGARHVFGHIGAGSFTGAATYLSRFYVSHPLLFRKEYLALEKICSIPRIYADLRGLIATPYDTIINQMVEDTRGDKRHGSCGVGFGETIERNLHPEFALILNDLNNLQSFLQKLITIRSEWLPKRLLALGISKISKEWQERIDSVLIMEDYIDAAGFFMRTVKQTRGIPAGFDHIVCEGAQGLLLDQDHPYFPHVTRSYTGIRNAMAVLTEAGITEADITYITRCYLTRHGAGPLPYELAEKPYPGIIDATNFTNEYQGRLRFAWLDIDRVVEVIKQDLQFVAPSIKVRHGLAVTCIDQIHDQAGFVQNGQLCRADSADFVNRLCKKVDADFALASFGPTRDDVRYLNI